MSICELKAFEDNFLAALERAFDFMAEFYGVNMDPKALKCIKEMLENLFHSNPWRVQRQIDHLMSNLPGRLRNLEKGRFLCRYAAYYAALLFAQTVVRIALQESIENPPLVICGYALMAIRDTDGWGWGDDA
jgi:hypothetical protein